MVIPHQVELERAEQGYECTVDGEPFALDVVMTARDVLSIIHNGRQYEAKREYSLMGETHIIIGSERFAAEVRDPRSLRSRRAAAGAEAGPAKILPPCPERSFASSPPKAMKLKPVKASRCGRSHEDAERDQGHQER